MENHKLQARSRQGGKSKFLTPNGFVYASPMKKSASPGDMNGTFSKSPPEHLPDGTAPPMRRNKVDVDVSPTKVLSLGPPPPGVPSAPAFVVLCGVGYDPRVPSVLDDEADPSTKAPNGCDQWPAECLHDYALGGVPPETATNRFEVRLVTGLGWKTLQRCVLQVGERCVAAHVCYLKKPSMTPPMRCCYVAAGTCFHTGLGEDAPARGRLLLFEVEYATAKRVNDAQVVGYVPRLKLVVQKELKGVVNCVNQLEEHVVVAVGNSLQVYDVKDGKFEQIAQHHAQVYIATLKVLKNYLLYCDVYQSAHLLFWRDRDRLLSLLAKDADHAGSDVRAADFVVDAGEMPGTHALGIVLADQNRVRLLQYAPLRVGKG